VFRRAGVVTDHRIPEWLLGAFYLLSAGSAVRGSVAWAGDSSRPGLHNFAGMLASTKSCSLYGHGDLLAGQRRD